MPARFGVAAMGMGSTRIWLVNEDCEGVGTPSGWTNGTGSPNWDYTAVPLAGAESVYLATVGAGCRAFIDFGDNTDVWAYFLMRMTNGSAPGVTKTLATFASNGSTTTVGNAFTLTSAGKFSCGASTANSPAFDTTYHVWLRYKAGTGADGINSVGFSTDGVRPTSGGNFNFTTSSSATASAGRLLLGTTGTNVFDIIYDNIRVATTLIGDNGT